MAVLKVKDLSIRFGGVQALKGVTFDVAPETFVGLMGPNGAGKTTLINCISGIYKAQSGTVELDGVNLLDLKPHRIAEVGVTRTFQDLGFFNQIPNMSVLDYLKLGQLGVRPKGFLWQGIRGPRSQAKEIQLKKRARDILEFFRDMRESFEPPQKDRDYPILYGRGGFADLIDVEDAPISSLSFAWRRRLDLARALISRPKVIMLDEPAQGLPPTEIENLGKLLQAVKAEFGISVLIVEHNVGILMTLSNEIVAMNQGEVVAKGSPGEIDKNKQVNEIYLGQNDGGAKPSFIPSPEVPPNTKPILDIRNLSLFYGQAQALSSVSIKVFPGQTACVLGTNGSGKSSLLRAVSGIETPSQGEILVDGEFLPLGWPEVAVHRGIQYVPQGHVIFPQLTVEQNLILGLAASKLPRKRQFEKVFNYFPDLKKLLSTRAVDLSGGQKQMLAIGQAIVNDPRVLLLDEPSLGLSPRSVDVIFKVINTISTQERCAILIVEQNVMKALEVSSHVFMLSSGLLISEGAANLYVANMDLVKKNLGFY